MTKEIEVSAVVPVYNDREALMEVMPKSLEILESIAPLRFELIIAEDGSSDGSAQLVKEWSSRDSRIHLLHSDERLGRGRALNRAFLSAKGSIVCYYDVDQATDMKHIPELISAIRDGNKVATGSRLLPQSNIRRSVDREIASRGYNLLVRWILKSPIYDHQCGFKSFHKESLLTIIPSIRSTHWFWDTEVLVRAHHKGYLIKEFPVIWKQGKGTTVKFKDIFSMGSAILRLKWQMIVERIVNR